MELQRLVVSVKFGVAKKFGVDALVVVEDSERNGFYVRICLNLALLVYLMKLFRASSLILLGYDKGLQIVTWSQIT